jgi:hypothetical protein
MEFKTLPWFTINRGWERIVADENGVINTENKEAIEVLTYLFPQEDLTPKTTKWKLQAKK